MSGSVLVTGLTKLQKVEVDVSLLSISHKKMKILRIMQYKYCTPLTWIQSRK